MPELPEVETVVQDLRARVLKKKIDKIEILLPKIVKNSISIFQNILVDNELSGIKRIGKLIIFELAKDNKYLLVHLKMTGQLVYQKKRQVIAGGHSEKNDNPGIMPNSWTRVIFIFNDSSKLYFNDLRTFGYLYIINKNELKNVRARFGLEPIDKKFNFVYLKSRIKNRTASIKALLLNQSLVAGIGNIYSDEILFQSGILPWRPGISITDLEIKKIIKASKAILKKAIKHRGTTFSDYVDVNGNFGGFSKLLKVFGRTGQKCLKCNNIIKKTKVAGRGTHYCDKCQS